MPIATETKIFVTARVRALRHFIEMRGDAAADVEIRKVAIAVLKLLLAESPNRFGDDTLVNGPVEGQAATTPYRKVRGLALFGRGPASWPTISRFRHGLRLTPRLS